MVVEITELFWQNVGVRCKIESRFTEFLLHSDQVEAETVFFSDLMIVWKFVDLLVFIQTFVLVRFARAT